MRPILRIIGDDRADHTVVNFQFEMQLQRIPDLECHFIQIELMCDVVQHLLIVLIRDIIYYYYFIIFSTGSVHETVLHEAIISLLTIGKPNLHRVVCLALEVGCPV